jgi:hypothetical protein
MTGARWNPVNTQIAAAFMLLIAGSTSASAEVIDLAAIKFSELQTKQKGRHSATLFIALNGARDGARTRDLRRDRAAL